MLPEGEPYIRRLPWSYIPHAHHGHSGHSGHTAQGAHFTPSVTHVGTKHAMQSPATSPQYIPQPQPQQGASGERRGVVSTDRTAAGTGAGVGGVPGEGQGEGEEMSFDEMLALSIMVRILLWIVFSLQPVYCLQLRYEIFFLQLSITNQSTFKLFANLFRSVERRRRKRRWRHV